MKKIFSFLLIIILSISVCAQIIKDEDTDQKRLNKPATSEDDAFGVLDKGELINVISNQGIISDTYYQNLIYNFRWPKSKGVAMMEGVNATDDVSVLFAHKGNVLDAYSRFRNEDWQAPQGARGTYHADDQPPELLAPDGAPRLAHSDLPLTWPKGYFDSLKVWHTAPRGRYETLSEADKKIVNSKAAYYDANKDVWRFWPGRFRIEVDPESQNYGKEVPGEFAADREVYSIFTDRNAQPPSVTIGITVELQAYSYGRRFAEDIQFYDFKITNNSSETLDSCWWGYYADLQFGDSFEETYGSYNTGINPKGYDNAFWQTDLNGPNPGNIEEGYLGYAVLKAPDNIGVTDAHFFRDVSGSITPSDDVQMWPIIISDPKNPNINPANYFHGPNTKFDDFSLTGAGKNPGINNWAMFCTSGPFTLSPGESFRATVAFAAGNSLEDFKKNIAIAQKLFLSEFNGPSAPLSPELTGVAGNRKVTLYWNNSSEIIKDPVSKKIDFEGYKIYRSEDKGATWGKQIINAQGDLVGYIPLAQFDKKDLIQGVDPVNQYNYLGSNTGLQYVFVDSTVLNGVEYSYTITAYDSGSVTEHIESLESARGTAPADANLVDITPRSNAIGYIPPASEYKQLSDLGKGVLDIFIADPSKLTSDSYIITFNKTPADSFVIKNNQTGKTLTKAALDSYEIPVTEGFLIKITGDKQDGGIKKITDQDGNNVFGSDHQNPQNHWSVSLLDTFQLSGIRSRKSDYEFRFTSDGSFAAGLTSHNKPLIARYHVPFEIWNVSKPDSSYQVNAILEDLNKDNLLSFSDPIRIINIPYNKNAKNIGDTLGIFSLLNYYYKIRIDSAKSDQPNIASLPTTGQSFTIYSYSSLSVQDTFLVKFKPQIISTSKEVVKSEINNIRVVPNPFVVNAKWEQVENNRRLRFMFLPPECSISIYTVRGELVKKITHTNGTGDEDWNLTNQSGVEVAYGLYIYAVETPAGEKTIGKFAIIK